ncbi:transcriptional regulator, AraC family [Duganella sp. CF517]|uniref:AraC family transcriptional regulator n=1 Tax=Duganella sp. CF517 TaxID=1881038 RepID=UPI0008C1A331|nr:AraC family transcriptional regulator [Duganella sp. CF517]SEN20969.1 transcriptional regulator, AraC family [Duganella sp. CF517]
MDIIGTPLRRDHDANALVHAPSSETATVPPADADLLSQVLTQVRLRGGVVDRAELSARWALRFPAGVAHFYYVEEGAAWLQLEGRTPFPLARGDLLLLPHRQHHTLRAGQGDAACRLIWGQFHFDGAAAAAVAAALPPILHLPAQDSAAPPWLNAITRFLLQEADGGGPGSALMVSRLVDLLVIRALRGWAEGQDRHPGWVAGLSELRLGRALRAIHAEPHRHWTVQALAELAGMSRSAFAERFTTAVGKAPLQYAQHWKLTLAHDMLAQGTPVGRTGWRSGYASEAAFSRAFARHFGYAPSTVRGRRA